MDELEIEKYREKIDQQLKEKEGEIEVSLSYISIGALGFFLTINEKFLKLEDCNLKFVLIISVFLLMTSFILILVKKSLTTKYDRNIIDFLDKMKPNSKKENSKLLSLWSKHDNTLISIKKSIYYTLAIGIILQVIFFMSNVL